MLEEMPERMSEEDMPAKMPENLPESMSEDMPESMSEEMPEIMSEDLPEIISERMSDEIMSQHMLEKCLKNAGRYTRKNAEIMFQYMPKILSD